MRERDNMSNDRFNAAFSLTFLFLATTKCNKGEVTVAKLESKFQKELMDEIRDLYPGCVIVKNDSSYIQGFPDWTIFYKDKYAIIEAKREKNAKHQPNQDHYVEKMNSMSFSRFAYPENKDEVLRDLDIHFRG
jgi:hypothetical protein